MAGRLPQTPTSQPDATHLVFSLEKAQSINHVTVFMDGTTPFPQGYAATVHLDQGGGGQWKLLGCLRNDKPSAIFRLRGAGAEAVADNDVTSLIGISIEEDAQVDAQMQALKGGAVGGADAGALVKAGAATATTAKIDPQVALALAPKIGESACVERSRRTVKSVGWVDFRRIDGDSSAATPCATIAGIASFIAPHVMAVNPKNLSGMETQVSCLTTNFFCTLLHTLTAFSRRSKQHLLVPIILRTR